VPSPPARTNAHRSPVIKACVTDRADLRASQARIEDSAVDVSEAPLFRSPAIGAGRPLSSRARTVRGMANDPPAASGLRFCSQTVVIGISLDLTAILAEKVPSRQENQGQDAPLSIQQDLAECDLEDYEPSRCPSAAWRLGVSSLLFGSGFEFEEPRARSTELGPLRMVARPQSVIRAPCPRRFVDRPFPYYGRMTCSEIDIRRLSHGAGWKSAPQMIKGTDRLGGR
jgi:hypothetical protein